MHSDDIYREFLLGTADRETEEAVEVALLDGTADPERLQQIESELIDDHLFGHLSSAEESAFQSIFLASPERIDKLEFARALYQHALRSAPAPVPVPDQHPSLLARLRAWAPMPWVLPLGGALGCLAVTALWLGDRNRHLNDTLALATHTNGELRQTLTEREDELRRRDAQSVAPRQPEQPQPLTVAPPAQRNPEPILHLSPGVSRGVATVPVLHLAAHADTAAIVLELPFEAKGGEPTGSLREELRDADDQPLWKQEFHITSAVARNGVTTVLLPAALLATGEYRLRAEVTLPGEDQPTTAVYLFRVRKD